MTLVRKVRHGSRLRRGYDEPQTPPWTRRLACPEADPVNVAALRRVLARTDPFALSERIDAQSEQVWTCANRVTRQPRPSVPKVPQPRGGDAVAGVDLQRQRLQEEKQAPRRAAAVAR